MQETELPLDRPISEEQLEFVSIGLRNSFDVETIRLGANKLLIKHREVDNVSAVENMATRYLFISKNLNRDRVFENSPGNRYTADPQPALEAVKDVKTIHPGFFSFQGDFLRVIHAVNAKVRQMAGQVHAIEQEYPTVWPVRLFKKIDYFHDFPQQVILCAPVRDDYSARDEFAKRYARDADFETVTMDGLMGPSEYGLEPAVCDCCYYGLEGEDDLADAFYTCYNKVFRNERSGSGSLDRLTNFSVRDIMFVGSEDFVLESRQLLIDKLSAFLSALQLEATIETANDPFFANDAAMKSVFQDAHRLKYELLARIPHADKAIAIGSINLHQDFFGRAFEISTRDGKVAHSGCVGVGMERAGYALFCQHGESVQEWPAGVIEYLNL